ASSPACRYGVPPRRRLVWQRISSWVRDNASDSPLDSTVSQQRRNVSAQDPQLSAISMPSTLTSRDLEDSHVRRPSTSWAVVSSASVALLISSACAPLSAVSFPKLGQSDDELLAQASAATDGASPANALVVRTANNTTAPQSAAATRGPRSVPVQRGSIDDVLDLFGQVVGRDEMALKPAATGRVATVSVKQGETVAQGQVLLEADSAYITSQIDEVQARIDTSSAHLTEIRAQADRRAQ